MAAKIDLDAAAWSVIEAAGAAGGIEEVRRIAKNGWPKNRGLEPDTAAFRAAIKRAAQQALEED